MENNEQFKNIPVIDFINNIKISNFHTHVVYLNGEKYSLIDYFVLLSYFEHRRKLLNLKYFDDVEDKLFERFLLTNSTTTALGVKLLNRKINDDCFALLFSFDEFRTIFKVLNPINSK